ncbi:Cytochrome c55X precursor NirC [hydrothermal vent metagenome]|uniref:Cytochrome c55X NirC n=1 Tax=hydrothermal vent metagenome TaxID=652676 RepID=A0A3B1C646_9ZZZZ
MSQDNNTVCGPGWLCIGKAYGVFLLLLSGLAIPAQAQNVIPISKARQVELINLLQQDCGACHGITLKGGLGPALTPERVRDKSPEMLVNTILHGRPGTPMPPWSPFLTREEARWLVNKLYQGIDHVQ